TSLRFWVRNDQVNRFRSGTRTILFPPAVNRRWSADGTSCSAEEARPTGDHARTSHLQSMSDAGRIRNMGPVSLLRAKSAAVTWVLTSQWAIEIARGPKEIGPP